MTIASLIITYPPAGGSSIWTLDLEAVEKSDSLFIHLRWGQNTYPTQIVEVKQEDLKRLIEFTRKNVEKE